MSLSFTQQPTSSVMSIGAITSPCSITNSHKSRQSSIDSTHSKASEYQLPSLSQVGFSSPNNAAVGHWIKTSNGTIDLTHAYDQSKRMRFASEGATIVSSPSFSSSASSDHESDSNSSCSQLSPIICKNSYPTASSNWLSSVYNMSDNRQMINNRNMYAKEALSTEHLLNDFDMEEYEELNHSRSNSFDYCDSQESNYMYSTDKGSNSTKTGRKGDALATRRARNKLASAKYRAKKQALTHAMQDRIMQLATQVMSLRDELSQTRKNETELLDRYERLATYYQRTNGKMNKNDNGNAASLF